MGPVMAACALSLRNSLSRPPRPQAEPQNAEEWLQSIAALDRAVGRAFGFAKRERRAALLEWTRACLRSPHPLSRALVVEPTPQPSPARLERPLSRSPERERRQCRTPGARGRVSTTCCCRGGALLVRRSGHLVRMDVLRREQQGLANVFDFEVRVEVQDLRSAEPVRDHPHHGGHRHPQASNARDATHLIGSDGDSREQHVGRLARAGSGTLG